MKTTWAILASVSILLASSSALGCDQMLGIESSIPGVEARFTVSRKPGGEQPAVAAPHIQLTETQIIVGTPAELRVSREPGGATLEADADGPALRIKCSFLAGGQETLVVIEGRVIDLQWDDEGRIVSASAERIKTLRQRPTVG